MDLIELRGSYSEMGRQFGVRLKGFFKPPPASPKKIEFAEKCLGYVEQYTPGVLDEIAGLCEAAKLDETLMRCFVLTLGLEMGCTVFAVPAKRNTLGVPVMARNYDWDVSFKDYFMCIRAQPNDGLTSLSFTDHMVGRYGGVNEKGLAAAITAIPAYTGAPKPGVRMNVAIRWMLDHLNSTEEAAEWLREVPHQWAHNYMLADRSGVFARVETSPEDTRVCYSEELLVTTNHYHDTEMKKQENPEFDFSNTLRRYKRVTDWYQKLESITFEDVKFVLSSHEEGVCDHGEHEGVVFGTIWSWIAPLGEKHVFVCHGPPCSNEFEKITF
jgi:predicted choloylglycine hydrolase